MGLFSKKEYVCEKCGKKFSKLINLNGNYCDDCAPAAQQERQELEKSIRGYVDYRSAVFFNGTDTTIDEMKAMLAYRDELVERFTQEEAITKEELRHAGAAYKQLSDDEIVSILVRSNYATASETMGAVYTNKFFMPTDFSGTIVDVQDVYAVGITGNNSVDAGNNEVIVCAVFTKDPYIPVFPMVFFGKKSMFEVLKSKKGREGVKNFFQSACPNLEYPVVEIKELKKIFKQENKVRGKLDVKKQLAILSDASSGSGIFNVKKVSSSLLSSSEEVLERMGYITESEITSLLQMDTVLGRRFWDKKIEQLSKK